MTKIIDDLLDSSVVDDFNKNNNGIKEELSAIKEKETLIKNVTDVNFLVENKDETVNTSSVLPEVFPEDKNISYENKVVDLSGAFDSVVEKKRQLSHTNTVDQKIDKKNKKRIYVFIILITWAIISFIGIFAIINNQKESKQREKAIQELQLKIQQDVKTQE